MTYKKDNITKSSLSNMALTFLSANSNAYPIAYADNVWDIIDSSSLLKALFGNEVLVGLYTQSDINNALAEKIANAQSNAVTLGLNNYGKVVSINSKDIYESLSPTGVSGENLTLSTQIGGTAWNINSATLNTIPLKKGQVLVVTTTNSNDQIGLTTDSTTAPSSSSSGPFYYKETNSTATYYIAVNRGNAQITYSIFDTLESKDSGKIDAIYLQTDDSTPQNPLLIQNKAVTINISNKVDKVTGKGLSTNDFEDSYKDKLDNIALGAQVNVQSDWDESDSSDDSYIKNKPTIPTVGTLNTTNTTSQTETSESLSGTIQLHKIAKTGSYNNLIDVPNLALNDYFVSSEISSSNHPVNGLTPEAGNYYFIKMASAAVGSDTINSKPVVTYSNDTYTAVTANAWSANDIINVYYQAYTDNNTTEYRFILIDKANGIYQTTANVEKILGDINAALEAIVGGS